MSSKLIRIPGIAGSLRRESYNRAALRAAAALVPEGAILDTLEFDGIPVLNQDGDQNPPPKVSELMRRIREADAILFVTPKSVAARFYSQYPFNRILSLLSRRVFFPNYSALRRLVLVTVRGGIP
jgi:hypothetical protein